MSGGAICGVCNEVEENPLVECFECGVMFHLNPRVDVSGKDCGDAILGDSMGIEMICNNCIAERREPSGPTGMIGMFAAMTGDALRLPPAATTSPPARDTSKLDSGERPRRRFRRIDR
ncbi:MAG: hypothetical protein DWI58_11510 [Chloroflexi bacterium]|nr:MAG: hypothetical protein DWI58_11510 [Chloroflexota bacterium]